MAVTQYIGLRYVPLFADPLAWDNTRTYEPLTIVLYQGASYTSRQAVPTGIDISNEDYWALTGNYNAQVEQYRTEVREAVSKVEEIGQQATASATAAKTSETNAGNSASAAATSAANAKASETAAAESATQAANSATAAGTSATNAAGSATQANNSAGAAATSASAAATSATNAEAAAANAVTVYSGIVSNITINAGATHGATLTIPASEVKETEDSAYICMVQFTPSSLSASGNQVIGNGTATKQSDGSIQMNITLTNTASSGSTSGFYSWIVAKRTNTLTE